MILTFEREIFIASGILAFSSLIISTSLIRLHLKHFSSPVIQSKIIGILWMVPIYALSSWLSIRFTSAAIYLSMIRDCYESYVLYLFLALLLAYLGDGDEDVVAEIASHQPRIYHAFPINKLCSAYPIPRDGSEFVLWCKLGTLQYAIIKPVTSLIAIILQALGLYHEADVSLSYGYVYISIIINISIAWSFYCLVSFYLLFAVPLRPFNPLSKFILIKAVIFLSFWQSIVIICLAYLGLFGSNDANAARDAIWVQNILICLEMFVASIAHWWSFGYEDYVDVDDEKKKKNAMDSDKREPLLSSKSILNTLDKHFSHETVFRDVNQVIPGARLISGAEISDKDRNRQTYLPLIDMTRNVGGDEVTVNF